MSAPLLPYGFARRAGVLPREGDDGLIHCLHRPGAGIAALLEMQRLHGARLRLQSIDEAGFEAAIAADYRDTAGDAVDLSDTDDLAALADSAAAVDDLLDSRDDSPVIRLINALLLQAVKDGASDVHVETQEKRLIVRFRVDGVLKDMIEPKRALAPLLVSRIKVMARLDIAEKRLPQDGRVTLRVGGHDIDVRVSTIPTQHGERVVMRLLDRGSAGLDMASLGMSERHLEAFRSLIDRPHGMLLVTGPTGSGKTTTLYTALAYLNDRKRNIMTVEDPIEYELAGVAQTQVNSRTGLDFARGLRAILRQDPDVIMVGEIRDRETADVAVRSSMTGHFVLSTLHTNSAIGAVTRLIDMGVERYLLAPMVVGLIAQRLVRRLCDQCRWQDRSTEAESLLLGRAIKAGKKIWRANGCDHCHGEGYRGRIGLYEIVVADDRLRGLVHDGASETALTAAAREGGPSLLEDGIAKLRAGLTSIEEVARVVRDES